MSGEQCCGIDLCGNMRVMHFVDSLKSKFDCCSATAQELDFSSECLCLFVSSFDWNTGDQALRMDGSTGSIDTTDIRFTVMPSDFGVSKHFASAVDTISCSLQVQAFLVPFIASIVATVNGERCCSGDLRGFALAGPDTIDFVSFASKSELDFCHFLFLRLLASPTVLTTSSQRIVGHVFGSDWIGSARFGSSTVALGWHKPGAGTRKCRNLSVEPALRHFFRDLALVNTIFIPSFQPNS